MELSHPLYAKRIDQMTERECRDLMRVMLNAPEWEYDADYYFDLSVRADMLSFEKYA